MAVPRVTYEEAVNQMENSNRTKSNPPTNELGKDAFLQLLMTQMQYQDPLNPMENTEMVAQLAQFSALEQMSNVYKSTAYSQGLNMIGKQIEATIYNESAREYEDVKGVVSSVIVKNGETYVRVGDKDVPVDKVQIATGIDEASFQQALSLVGKTIQAITSDPSSDGTMVYDYVEGKVERIKKVNGVPMLVVGNKEIFMDEFTTVDDNPILLGRTVKATKFDGTVVEGPVDDIHIKIDSETEEPKLYAVIGGEEFYLENIADISTALSNVGKQVNTSIASGTVDGVTIKGGLIYLNVGDKLVAFKDAIKS